MIIDEENDYDIDNDSDSLCQYHNNKNNDDFIENDNEEANSIRNEYELPNNIRYYPASNRILNGTNKNGKGKRVC